MATLLRYLHVNYVVKRLITHRENASKQFCVASVVNVVYSFTTLQFEAVSTKAIDSIFFGR